MKILKNCAVFSLVAVAAFASAAPIKNVTCSFALEFEYFPDVYPELLKSCSDVGESQEACTSFSFQSKGGKYSYRDTGSGIVKEGGFLAFKPVTLSSFQEKVNGAAMTTWLLSFIDNSGSPSRSEERFLVIDGAFKAKTKLMSYVEKEQYFKSRPASAASLGEVPAKCKVTRGRQIRGAALYRSVDI